MKLPTSYIIIRFLVYRIYTRSIHYLLLDGIAYSVNFYYTSILMNCKMYALKYWYTMVFRIFWPIKTCMWLSLENNKTSITTSLSFCGKIYRIIHIDSYHSASVSLWASSIICKTYFFTWTRQIPMKDWLNCLL